MTLDVLIVGAGPVGLALACNCRKLGLSVRILDKKAGPSTTSKAIGLQYRISEILAIMGVVDRFLERGSSPTRITMLHGDREMVTLHFVGMGNEAGRDAFAPRAIMLPQSETEELLHQLLHERDAAVEWNTEFLRFDPGADGIVSTVRRADGGEEQIASAYLVSCEGAHSVIRKQAGFTFEGATHPHTFYMADVEVDWDRPHEEHYVWFHPEGSFAALSLPKPRTFRLFIEMDTQLSERTEPLSLDDIRGIMRRRLGEKIPEIGNPTWLSEFRINARMVNHYRQGRVFLAGDAAHIHSPNGGQGIVTGIQDATNLAWKLARVTAGAPDSLLDTYEEERLPKAREVLHETNKIAGIFTANRGPKAWLRDFLVLPLLRMRWLQRRMFAKLAQLHVGYRGCRLARHEDNRWFRRTRLRAGDRAPDVALLDADNRPTTLFRLLEPMRPIALVAGPDAESALPLLAEHAVDGYLLGAGPSHPRGLQDRHGDFRRIYGMTGGFVCLLRPDGHIGLFQRPIHEANLRDYLKQLSR